MNCILSRIARKTDFGTYLVPTFLLMDGSANELLCFRCGHSRDSNGYYCATASWVPYHIHTTPCDHPPCKELGFSTPHNMIYLGNHHGDRQKIQLKKRYPGRLAHAVTGMFYSVFPDQRQPHCKRGGGLILYRAFEGRANSIIVA